MNEISHIEALPRTDGPGSSSHRVRACRPRNSASSLGVLGMMGGDRLAFANVANGTLRATKFLIAVNQLASDGRPIKVVNIKKPETSCDLAAGTLSDAPVEASTDTYVLVTTHRADLLGGVDPETDALRLAFLSEGSSRLSPLDVARRKPLPQPGSTAVGSRVSTRLGAV